MKRYVLVLTFSLILVLVAVIGLQTRPAPAPIAGSDTVAPKGVPVGEYYVQVGSFTGLLGDFDDDGDITTTDARLILQAVVGKYGDEGDIGVDGLLEYEVRLADVDQDDAVTTTDARLILQAVVGKLTEFPDPTTTTTTIPTTTAPTRKEPSLSSDPVEDLTAATNPVVNENPDTFCNPLNIAYGYQSDADHGYREGADPVIQVYRGEYYLFVSHAYGYWWSKDLANWEFVACTEAEMDKWAPASCVVGDTLYLTHSQGGSIFKSTDPKNGKWERVGQPIYWDDPALYYDEDDGYVYSYYGCSDNGPLFVVQLDPEDNMALVNGPFECFFQNREAHGFENTGDNNTNTAPEANCWLEGAWAIKHNGKYYLNYAVPGTDKNYANGCYVSKDGPFGPFEFCENSPFTMKPTGFVQGIGHGAVFQDLWGNWWCVETSAISQNAMWERRIQLLPITFDDNDNLISDTVLMDYPMYVPALIEDNFGDQAQPDWHLLSYNVTGSASSTLNNQKGVDKALDENFQTWWSAKTGNAGEWLTIDMGKLCEVNALQISFADQDADKFSGRDHTFCYNYLVEFSGDGETWYTLVDHTGITAKPFEGKDTSHDYYELVSAIGARYIRVTNKGAIPANGKFAISGLRVFGNGRGEAPAAVEDFTVSRPASNERSVTIQWDPVEGADGYVIRFGYAENIRHQAYHVYGTTKVTLNSLNMGVDYWYSIDAFNDSGYTTGKVVHNTPATVEAPANKPVTPPVVKEYILSDRPIYEAEGGTIGGGAMISRAPEDAKASGGTTLHNMHLEGAFFEVTGVDGGKGGDATLHLGYATANYTVRIEIFVNGQSQGITTLSSSHSWSQFTSQDIAITGLTAEETNTIRIVCGRDGGINADFFQIVPAE